MKTLNLLVVCLGLVSPAFAQKAEPTIKAKLRLLAYSGELEHPEVFLHDPAAKPDAVPVQYEIRGFLNSESITLPLKSRKVVFTLSKERDSMTNPEQLLGRTELDAACDSAIVLFLPPKPGADAKFDLLSIPDSIKVFPPGSFRISNLSGSNFKLQLEDKPFEVKAGETLLIENPPTKSESSQIGMRAFIFKDDAWTEFSSSIWSHPGHSRSLMVLSDNPAGGNVRFRAFDDVKPQNPSEPAGKKGRKKSKSK